MRVIFAVSDQQQIPSSIQKPKRRRNLIDGETIQSQMRVFDDRIRMVDAAAPLADQRRPVLVTERLLVVAKNV